MNRLTNGKVTELYRRYRPRSLDELWGQDSAVRQLADFLKRGEVPHALLLTGPSGTGKTTAARILKRELGCHDADFCEINAAESRGIDTVRDIARRVSMAPMGGACRMWVYDECHIATREAQSAILKLLEDTPLHVYFVLCTTDPVKLLKTILTRCTEIKMRALESADMTGLLRSVCERGKIEQPDTVLERIIEVADGSARKALVLLGQVAGLTDEQEALDAVLRSDGRKAAIDVARALIKPGAKWADVAALLKACDEEPETIRRLVLGYANTVALGGGQLMNRAISIIDEFGGNVFDSGKAGLTLAAHRVLHGR